MHRFAVGLMLTLLVSMSPQPAGATTVNMSIITCKALFVDKKDPTGGILMWMNGHYAGRAGSMTLDTEKHIETARRVGEHCARNPNASVIELLHRFLAE